MEFCRNLLVGLGFHPGKIRLNMAKGKRTNISVATKSGWLITLSRSREVRIFADTIGFADTNKQQKLVHALSLVDQLGVVEAGKKWPELYEKTGRVWRRKALSS
jgi:hypothetical protein